MLSEYILPMVKDCLDREGQTVTINFKDITTDTYDPTTGEFTQAAATSVVTKAVFLDFAILANGLQTKLGNTIEINDKQVYILPQSTFPRHLSPTGDTITDRNGKVWRIMLIKEYNTIGNVPMMFDCLVRA